MLSQLAEQISLASFYKLTLG